jgi:membrane protease YdiL (CAAX protease family)
VELLRTLGPLLLAVVTALYLDRAMERRGALPPRFAGAPASPDAPLRRALGVLVIGAILWAGAFAPLTAIGEAPPDPAELSVPRLFLLHGLLVLALAAWYAVGYLPHRAAAPLAGRVDYGLERLERPELPEGREEPETREEGREVPEGREGAPSWRAAFRLDARSPRHELAVGTAIGLAIWLSVLLVLLLLAGLVSLLGGREALPAEPPSLVLWIGALPILARVAIALSAGVVEEIFFRGFLQPRIGVLPSTALFALAHVGYGQPFMLVGVTLLSLLYAELARRRGSVWAPIAAHSVFDLVQLLVVVPLVARALEHRDTLEAVAAHVGPAG